MVIFESRFATLEHEPGLGLLKVTYGDRRGYQLTDVAVLMRHVGECAVAHGVKNLLLDSSRSFNPMPDSEVEAAVRHIIETCHTSGIERVARVSSPSQVSEFNILEEINHFSQTEPLRYTLRTFSTKEEAMRWLAPS